MKKVPAAHAAEMLRLFHASAIIAAPPRTAPSAVLGIMETPLPLQSVSRTRFPPHPTSVQSPTLTAVAPMRVAIVCGVITLRLVRTRRVSIRSTFADHHRNIR
jgi:hypothetical protein